MAEWTWTTRQQQAIETIGTNLLVSAGAGSGKTAVLAERCAHLVADLRPACPVDRLLVATFTDAAAMEMRQRIAQTLRERLADDPTNRWLQQQLAMMDAATISTIHSFCKRTLTRYFALADLDPIAPLMDPHEAALLWQDTARTTFDKLGQRDDAPGEAFLDLLGAYSGASERQLIDSVQELDAFLASLPDPDQWVMACRDAFRIPAGGNLPDAWRAAWAAAMEEELSRQHAAVSSLLESMPRTDGTAPASEIIDAYRTQLADWLNRLQASQSAQTLDAICRDGIAAYSFDKMPTKASKLYKNLPPDDQAAFEKAADAVRNIKKTLLESRLQERFGHHAAKDWADGIARTAPHVGAFLDLVHEVRQAYQAAKHDLGVIDFNDLERMTLDLLRNKSAGVAARLRDQFRFVLVDEFQDINRVQAEILRLVSRGETDDRDGNLFCVGDVKQSIYRFRLAEPRLFIERNETYRAAAASGSHACGVVDLVENFRSNPALLDAINAVFRRLMASDLGGIEYDEHAELQAGRKENTGPALPPIELHVLEDKPSADAESDAGDDAPDNAADWQRIEREAYVVAQRIHALVEQGVGFGDIAILVRAIQRHGGLFVRTLTRLGVPTYSDTSDNALDALEVLDVLSLLMLLDNQQQDIPLAAVLRSPLFGEPLNDDQLVEIKTAASNTGGATPFHAAVRAYADAGRDGKLREHLADMFAKLHDWRRRIRLRPLADVLWAIYEESGYYAYVAGLTDGPRRQANLVRLHEHARQFDSFKRQGLHRFLEFIDDLREQDRDLESGAAAAPLGDVVRLMTIHKSKGLEFPVVFVAELGKRFNQRDAAGKIVFDRNLGIAMEAIDLDKRIRYTTLPHMLVTQAIRRESLAEELRVLYVAMTRAKQKLILVGSGKLDALDEKRALYAGHDGPLPLLERERGGSMLGWITAALACQPPESVRDVAPPADESVEADAKTMFTVRRYDGAEMATWAMEKPRSATSDAILERAARFDSLADAASLRAAATTGTSAEGTAPTPADVLAVVRRRLTMPYAREALTKLPAVIAASELKRRWDTQQDDEEPAVAWAQSHESSPQGSLSETIPDGSVPKKPARVEPATGKTAGSTRSAHRLPPRLPTPAFLARGTHAEPTQIGTWTHALLQWLDLAQPCDAADLIAQRDKMIERAILTPEQAAAIDLDAVAWFCASPLGQRLRSAADIKREWPFVMGIAPNRYEPSLDCETTSDDALLVRGIIDCVFDAGDGWEILDYKTDAVRGDALAARAALYRGQLRIYREAFEASHATKVRRCWLAFLSAREIVEVS